jgi:hypothetical protein
MFRRFDVSVSYRVRKDGGDLETRNGLRQEPQDTEMSFNAGGSSHADSKCKC